ncbi:MAG TPA: ATP-binding protein, partial [Actinomycetota bacterium]
YQGLVENLPAIAYTESIRDTDGGIVYMSPQARDLLGFEPEELTGPPEQWLQVVHPEDRDRVREQNQHSDATGEPFVIEYRIVGRDGRVRWVHDESRLVRDDDGVPRFWQGVMFDITRRMDTEHLERELEAERQEAAELRALDELKNTFLQAVSHDLRTPLAAILGLAVTLERQEGLPPEDARDLAARIATNARKLDRMVTDLLDLERLSRGIVEPKLRWIDVGALARRVVEESEVVSGREVDVRSSEVFARVDAAKVERILENLLSNAVRHTPAGTRLWVRVGPEGGGVLLVVEDEGPGVPPAIREAIFQPFQRGLGASEYSPGVGIGLTLVARFAELHGGRAWVHDREGGGASFQVWLPAGEPDAPLPD